MKERITRILQTCWENADHFVHGATLYYTICHYGMFMSWVDGPSMLPTFPGRGWNTVLAECLPGVASRVQLGDVVICKQPNAVTQNVIKRVTAVEGQQVSVFRPGQHLPLVVTVPRGHVWLQGDNLIMSRDSREYGPVPRALVRGRVIAQIWPTPKVVDSHLPGSV